MSLCLRDVLYSLTAGGTKDLLYNSLLHRGEISLQLKLLLNARRGSVVLSMVTSNLCTILFSATTSRVTRSCPMTELTFNEFLQLFSITPFHTSAPTHHSVKQRTVHHKMLKHIRYFTTGLKSQQKIQLTLSLPVYCLHVFSPVKLIFNVDPQESTISTLHPLSQMNELFLFPPEDN